MNSTRVEFPKISIVTPSYNQSRYLEKTIRSVLNQNYKNLEYIVMDGGSTDGSVEIIERYADKLIHWESHKDEGQADAIYRGFERATGEIIGWVNSDDILLPGSLEKVSQYFVKNQKKEWVVGSALLIDSDGQYLRDQLGNPRCTRGFSVSLKSLLYWECGFNQPASFWRRDVFFKTGGFNRSLKFSFDYDLFLRLANRQASGQIDDFIACFRIHPTSKTSTIRNICDEENEDLWKKHGRSMKNKVYRLIIYNWFFLTNRIRIRLLQLKMYLGIQKYPEQNVR